MLISSVWHHSCQRLKTYFISILSCTLLETLVQIMPQMHNLSALSWKKLACIQHARDCAAANPQNFSRSDSLRSVTIVSTYDLWLTRTVERPLNRSQVLCLKKNEALHIAQIWRCKHVRLSTQSLDTFANTNTWQALCTKDIQLSLSSSDIFSTQHLLHPSWCNSIANGYFYDLFAQFMSSNVALGQDPGSLVDIVKYIHIIIYMIYIISFYIVIFSLFNSIYLSMVHWYPSLLYEKASCRPLQNAEPRSLPHDRGTRRRPNTSWMQVDCAKRKSLD